MKVFLNLFIITFLFCTNAFSTEEYLFPKIIRLGFVNQKRTLSYLPSMKDKLIDKSFELAVNEFNASDFARSNGLKVEIFVFDVGEKKLDIQRAFDRAIKSDVLAVVGLTTSREALLVGEMAQASKILTISTAGGHDKIGHFGDYVYSHSGAMSSYALLMGDYIIKKKPKRVLLISNNNEPYSKSYADSIHAIIDGKVELKRVDIPDKQLIRENQLFELQKERFDLIVLTLYAYQGVMTLNSLQDYGVADGQTILVSPSWYYDSLVIEKYLNKPQKIVCYSSWSEAWEDSLSKKFIAKFKGVYGYVPGTSDALAYDVANEIFTAVKIADEYTREGLKRAHDKIKNYRGVIGSYYYDNCGGHPRVNYFLSELSAHKKFILKDVGLVPKKECHDENELNDETS